MIAKRNSYQGKRTDWPADEVFLEFRGLGVDPKIPKVIRNLHREFAIIRSNSVMIAVSGGFNHLAFEAYAEGAEESGTKKLINGLWLIYD